MREIIYVFVVWTANSSHSELVSLITNGRAHTPAGVLLSTGGSPSVQPPNFASSTSRPAKAILVIRDFPQSLRANTRTVHHIRYGRITSTKSPSFCMTTYTARPQILRPSYLSHMIAVITYADEYWHLQRTDCRNTLTYAHSPDLWHQSRLANVTCAWSCRLCGINPDITTASFHIVSYYSYNAPATIPHYTVWTNDDDVK